MYSIAICVEELLASQSAGYEYRTAAPYVYFYYLDGKLLLWHVWLIGTQAQVHSPTNPVSIYADNKGLYAYVVRHPFITLLDPSIILLSKGMRPFDIRRGCNAEP